MVRYSGKNLYSSQCAVYRNKLEAESRCDVAFLDKKNIFNECRNTSRGAWYLVPLLVY